MNLQALFELKERLEHAAIAGTGLVGEDFRLQRAIDAMTPLAKASPVFAKIVAGAKALLAAPAEERGSRLLDVLSLVDAVVYTQGTSAISGELIPGSPGKGSYTRIPYGTLRPLLEALGGSGSGRTALIKEYWSSHPEYFRDFRVLPQTVLALRDNYVELADLVGEILTTQGQAAIPLLKAGFDPAGKTEMVRRVRLIAHICGASENEWYLAMLPETKKDVRVALIEALGMAQWNTQMLLDLCRTEKGKAREAALRALAQMDAQEATAFWEAEVKKKPDSVFCLAGVKSRIAADLAAISFRALIERILRDTDKGNRNESLRVMNMVAGNDSPALAEVWRFASEHMDEIHARKPANGIRGYEFSDAELMMETMMESLIANPSAGMIALAEELAHKNRKWFLCCGVLADLIQLKPESHFEKYAHRIVPNETDDQRNDRIQIMIGLENCRWDQERKRYTVSCTRRDPASGQMIGNSRPIEGFDNRWLAHLTNPDIQQDVDFHFHRHASGIDSFEYWLLNMICPDDKENRGIIGSWLYRKLRLTGKLQPYVSGLLSCGWKNWKGVLTFCASHASQVMYHQYINLLAELPISNREKAAELRELDELVSSGRVSVWNRHWPEDRIQYLIAKLENEDNLEIL